jgi:hypothetical protein
MGGGASSARQDLDRQLSEAIAKLSKMKLGKLLTGEQVEDAIGAQLYDCNAFDIYAVPDDSKRGLGVHKVSREDLLKALQVHQVLNNADAKVPLPTSSELEKLGGIMLARNLALAAARPLSDSSGLRGAVAPLAAPGCLYTPLLPPDADATTVTYPYAAALVLLFQKRPPPDEGWNLGLWRSGATGEWTTITATYAARHAGAAAKPHQLRSAAAEALLEQSCGLLRVAPGRQPLVLRDACATSVVWDGGPPLDGAAHPRPLVQLFAVRVDGVGPDDLRANREALSRNIGGSLCKGHWLQFDELAFTRLEDVPSFHLKHPPSSATVVGLAAAAGAAAGSNGRSGIARASVALTDTSGRVCPCRQLLELLARPRAPSALTLPLPDSGSSTASAAHQPSVLAELVTKLEAAVRDGDGGEVPNPKEGATIGQSYHAGRWFAATPVNASALMPMDGIIVMARTPESGGLLAGCETALLTSTSNVAVRSSVW